MQFVEYVFTITFVYVLNYPFEYPNYPNDFVVFGQMSLFVFVWSLLWFCIRCTYEHVEIGSQ